MRPFQRVFLHLTRNCNLRCTYCYAGDKVREDMSLEVGQRALDFFFARTRHLMIQFFGGEPLLRFKRMRELHAYAEARKASHGAITSYVVVTNGTLFTQEVADFCREARVAISLSLDGNEPAQNAARVLASGRGSFARIERNLDRILGCGQVVHVVSVVHPGNVRHLADSLRFLLERGFRSIALSPDLTHPDFADSLPLFEERLAQAAEIYLEHRRAGRRVFVDVFDDRSSVHNRHRCSFGQDDVSVAPDGRIYPCCCFVDHGVMPLGNVVDGFDPEQTGRLELETDALARHVAVDHGSCPSDSYCQQGCACNNIVASGKISETPSAACAFGDIVHRQRLRVLDALGQHLRQPDPER